MTYKDNGKKIKWVWLPGDGNAYHASIQSGIHGDLEFEQEDFGDHAECWIIVKKDGKEIERINSRQVTSIIWA